MLDEEILDAYYPPRTGEMGDDGDKESGEWYWEGHEHDEAIPWTFSCDEIDTEEKFLVLFHAWNRTGPNGSIHLTSTDRFPHRPDSIHESYDTIIYYGNKIWHVGINQNMGLEWLRVIQALPEHFAINGGIEFKIEGEYWDGLRRQDLSKYKP